MTKLMRNGQWRLSRLTVAAFMLLASGAAVSVAADLPRQTANDAAKSQKSSAAAAQPKAPAKVAGEPAAPPVAVQTPERRGVIIPGSSPIPPIALRDPNMSPEEAMRLIQLRAAELAQMPRNSLMGYSGVIAAPTDLPGLNPPSTPPGGTGGSGGGLVRTLTNQGGLRIDSTPPPRNPGDWPPSDGPRIGEGVNSCITPLMARNWPSDTRAFVDTNNLWRSIPLPANAPDFDGDGEPDNPLPHFPVIIYFQILTEEMVDIDWVDGDDNLNLIGLRGEEEEDPDNPGTFLPGELEDTDGLADTWVSDVGRLNLSIIPPPDPNEQVEARLADALGAMGLGRRPWGNERPAFRHPDAEAAYYLAQREYGGTPGFTFFDTFSSGQVPDPEEMVPVIMAALQAISEVCNVIFIQRAEAEFPGANLGAGYPFAPMGYTLDSNIGLLNPGSFFGGLGDTPFNPIDDYPWILIVQGSPDRQGSAEQNFATRLGMDRGPGIPIGMQSELPITADLNGDGFPDMVDLDGDGISDQIILSNYAWVDADGRTVLDRNPGNPLLPGYPNGVGVEDSSFVRLVFNGPGFLPLGLDLNGDGSPDFLLDPNNNGDTNVVDIFSLQIDLGIAGNPGGRGDLIGDSVTGVPGDPLSTPPVLLRPIPCELINISSPNIGVMVHEMMHHMGFMHEQSRPDRDDYVKINIENIEPQYIGNFSLSRGGIDRYATYIDNFDTTNANGVWAVQGVPIDGAWQLAVPVNAGLGDPPADYAVDEDDLSLFCYVTGNLPGQSIIGETILVSPQVYGPKGARVNFAYWLNSVGVSEVPEGDGLFMEISSDGGATWEPVWSVSTTADEWRIGEYFITGDQGSNTFVVRFIARGLNTEGVIVEAGIDRFRVLGPYDFESIMHYGPFAFSSNGRQTIEARPEFSEFANRIGGRNGFTIGDRAALQNLYGRLPPPDGYVGNFDPCRADVNEDGLFNAQDVLLYIQWYNAGDLRADFAQPEGVINFLDMLQFFVDFQNSFLCLPSTPPNILGGNNLQPLDPL